MIALGFANFLHVLAQLIESHPPIIEVVLAHRRMIAETNFLQPDRQRPRRILGRFAGSMAAKRRMHVIISGPAHGAIVRLTPQKGQRFRMTTLISRKPNLHFWTRKMLA